MKTERRTSGEGVSHRGNRGVREANKEGKRGEGTQEGDKEGSKKGRKKS